MSRLEVSKLSGTTASLGQVSIPTGTTLNIDGTLHLNRSDAYTLPSGPESSRPTPAASAVGVTRFNTDTSGLEVWTGTEWVSLDVSTEPNAAGGSVAPPNTGETRYTAGFAASEVTENLAATEPTQRWIDPGNSEAFQIYVASDIDALGNIPSGGPSWVSNVTGLNIISKSVINQTDTMMISIQNYQQLMQRLCDEVSTSGSNRTPYIYWSVWDTGNDNLIGITRTWFTNCTFNEFLDVHTGDNPSRMTPYGGTVTPHWDVWGTSNLPSGTAYTVSDDTSSFVRCIPYRANSNFTDSGDYGSTTSYGLHYKRYGDGEHYPWRDTSDVNTSEGYFRPSSSNSLYGFTGSGSGIHHYIFVAET